MNILVSGLINIETTVSVRGFPINYYPIDYPFFGIGSQVSGVGYNILKALCALGDKAELHSFIGKDEEGERIQNRMKKDGFSADHIIQSLQSTPVSCVLFDPQGRRQIYCDLKDIQEQSLRFEDIKDDLQSVDAAVLCNIGFNRELIKRAKACGVLTATDVHVLSVIEDDYNRDFMENADILFLSDENLPCAAEDFIRQLHRRYHNRVIVIGMGAKGAMLFDAASEKVSVIPAYSGGKVVNTVGAGDALFSSFLHFYLKDHDAEKALQKAVIFSGVKIMSNGASVGFCSEKETEDIFNHLN